MDLDFSKFPTRRAASRRVASGRQPLDASTYTAELSERGGRIRDESKKHAGNAVHTEAYLHKTPSKPTSS